MIENCPMRHENGNCIPAGGFCTANKNICEALLNAYRMGKAQLSHDHITISDLPGDTRVDELVGIGVGEKMYKRHIKGLPAAEAQPENEGDFLR